MSFTVSGRIDGEPVTLTWRSPLEPGDRLEGDFDFLYAVEAAVGERLWASPTGPEFVGSVESADLALLTMVAVLDTVGPAPEVTGVAPNIDLTADAPADAVF